MKRTKKGVLGKRGRCPNPSLSETTCGIFQVYFLFARTKTTTSYRYNVHKEQTPRVCVFFKKFHMYSHFPSGGAGLVGGMCETTV